MTKRTKKQKKALTESLLLGLSYLTQVPNTHFLFRQNDCWVPLWFISPRGT
ncbi:hypothetical protein VCHA50O407_50158 [Vibrio chagasii]|nr:hypothetical protein VCHA40P240_100188 [Vibrio chagasii]CAH7210684.1 hypothetical protein VCHA54P495_20338 [Vibrio chagasii]CAH7214581.1 hypothetical protein VCHA54P496_20338 [Vibrio chagasii]CAH7349581.1 hypothetical protein VCHA50O407_50158 [Vibrio chagasii]CAH7451195.1 hypothetical protein VCHA38O210_40163 [Vibrio chagasii]